MWDVSFDTGLLSTAGAVMATNTDKTATQVNGGRGTLRPLGSQTQGAGWCPPITFLNPAFLKTIQGSKQYLRF